MRSGLGESVSKKDEREEGFNFSIYRLAVGWSFSGMRRDLVFPEWTVCAILV